MHSYEKFYLEKLYPFQDGVMRIIRKLGTPFFLTGGTALGRHYFNHRFSEDIDLVNDVAQHYGSFETHPALGKIDSWRNILSNKFSALFRFEPKDIADIWIIARNRQFSWKDIVRESKTKESGVEPETVFHILKSFPEDKLNILQWIQKPEFSQVKSDLERISEDIFYGRDNSLAGF